MPIALLALAGCIPHVPKYSFAGGALPDVHTMAIQPFDNETPSPELQKELLDAMRKDLISRLGVRDAPLEKSDAVIRGIIRIYDSDVPVAFSADPSKTLTSRRKLQITVDVEIVDQNKGKTIWERKGLRAEGDYAERDEVGGRREAIKRIVNDIVEGAQSQW